MILYKYQIREAKLDDCNRITDELWKPFIDFCCEYEFSELDTEAKNIFSKYFHEIIKDDNSVVYIAEVSSHLVGYTVGTIRKNPPVYKIKEVGEISDLYVKPDYRNQGIGRSLVESVEKWFEEKGLNIIWLRTHYQNMIGNSFWKGLGYNSFAIERIKKLR